MSALAKWLYGVINMPVIADPGTAAAILAKSSRVYFTVGAGVETNTVPEATENGLTLLLCMDIDGGGTRAVTFPAAINAAGNTVATFGVAGQAIQLRSVEVRAAGVSTFHWVVEWILGAPVLS